MTLRAQVQKVEADLVARLHLTRRRIKKYCKEAARAGHTSRLDQLAALLTAANAEAGTRGPLAEDPITAAIFRDGPRRGDDAASRVRAEIRRQGGWREQVVGEEIPRDAHAFAQWCAAEEATRRFPGSAPPAARQRAAYRNQLAAGVSRRG